MSKETKHDLLVDAIRSETYRRFLAQSEKQLASMASFADPTSAKLPELGYVKKVEAIMESRFPLDAQESAGRKVVIYEQLDRPGWLAHRHIPLEKGLPVDVFVSFERKADGGTAGVGFSLEYSGEPIEASFDLMERFSGEAMYIGNLGRAFFSPATGELIRLETAPLNPPTPSAELIELLGESRHLFTDNQFQLWTDYLQRHEYPTGATWKMMEDSTIRELPPDEVLSELIRSFTLRKPYRQPYVTFEHFGETDVALQVHGHRLSVLQPLHLLPYGDDYVLDGVQYRVVQNDDQFIVSQSLHGGIASQRFTVRKKIDVVAIRDLSQADGLQWTAVYAALGSRVEFKGTSKKE